MKRVIFAIVAASMVAGCAPQHYGTPFVPASVPNDSRLSAAVVQSLIYALDFTKPAASIDDYSVNGGKPLRSLPAPNGPIAVDGNGTFYGVNSLGSIYSIAEYAAGATKPLRTMSAGISAPQSMTATVAGGLFLTKEGGPIVAFAPGATKPSASTSAGMCPTNSIPLMATDASGLLYVLNVCGVEGQKIYSTVTEYDAKLHLVRTIRVPESQQPYDFAVAPNGGVDVAFFNYAADASIRPGIAEYAPAATSAKTAFLFGPKPPKSAVSISVGSIAVDASGRVAVTYVGCYSKTQQRICPSEVDEYENGATTPAQTVHPAAGESFTGPWFDAGGNVYAEILPLTKGPTQVFRFAFGGSKGTRVLSARLLVLGIWPGGGRTATFAHLP